MIYLWRNRSCSKIIIMVSLRSFTTWIGCLYERSICELLMLYRDIEHSVVEIVQGIRDLSTGLLLLSAPAAPQVTEHTPLKLPTKKVHWWTHSWKLVYYIITCLFDNKRSSNQVNSCYVCLCVWLYTCVRVSVYIKKNIYKYIYICL